MTDNRKKTSFRDDKKILNKERFSGINNTMNFPAHYHDYFEIVITCNNNYMHTINGKCCQPNVGDVLILRPTDWHSAVPIDDTRECSCRDIFVPTQMFISVCDFLDADLYRIITEADNPPGFRLNDVSLIDLEQKLRYPFFLCDSIINDDDRQQIEILKKGIVTEIITGYLFNDFISQKKMPECIIRLMSNLQDNTFAERSIEDMAAELGYSHTYLCKQFKAHFGKSLERYLIDERVEKSIPLLLQTDMSVRKIAASLGWYNPGNYIKAFTRIYGITPLKYRNSTHGKAIHLTQNQI